MAIQLRSGLITCILILFGSNDAKQSDDLYIANTIGNKDVPNGIENKSFNYQMKRALTRSDNEGEETTSTEHPMLRPLICTFVPSIPECFFIVSDGTAICTFLGFDFFWSNWRLHSAIEETFGY